MHGRLTDRKLYWGLIGAQTMLSGGKGNVKDYAKAARQAGLDFVVFLEDFAKLDEEELQKLKDDCERYSDGEIMLYPGYRIKVNTGNNMFLYGFPVKFPPQQILVGSDKKELMLQYEKEPVVYTYGFAFDKVGYLSLV